MQTIDVLEEQLKHEKASHKLLEGKLEQLYKDHSRPSLISNFTRLKILVETIDVDCKMTAKTVTHVEDNLKAISQTFKRNMSEVTENFGNFEEKFAIWTQNVKNVEKALLKSDISESVLKQVAELRLETENFKLKANRDLDAILNLLRTVSGVDDITNADNFLRGLIGSLNSKNSVVRDIKSKISKLQEEIEGAKERAEMGIRDKVKETLLKDQLTEAKANPEPIDKSWEETKKSHVMSRDSTGSSVSKEKKVFKFKEKSEPPNKETFMFPDDERLGKSRTTAPMIQP